MESLVAILFGLGVAILIWIVKISAKAKCPLGGKHSSEFSALQYSQLGPPSFMVIFKCKKCDESVGSHYLSGQHQDELAMATLFISKRYKVSRKVAFKVIKVFQKETKLVSTLYDDARIKTIIEEVGSN